jgi:orotidine-5'-phosphate decarboxylase
MNYQQIIGLIKKKHSFLCVGLDADPEKIPPHLLKFEDPIFEFNRQIIDATIDFAVAYKPNMAFYESEGIKGWRSLEKTINYLRNFKDSVFTIADAKRGDIGNTSERYAKAFLAEPPAGFGFDAITVAPYMGSDSVKPFLKYPDKWVILLALTSNSGAFDFQTQKLQNGQTVFETVIRKSLEWGNNENMMYVVGATQTEMLAEIRAIIPDHFLLIPGVGAQGGSLDEVAGYGMNKNCGILVNSSRGIIYASNQPDFAAKAREEAFLLKEQMEQQLNFHGIFG